jgi:hypothetical protein
MTQVVEYLPEDSEALSSNLSTMKKDLVYFKIQKKSKWPENMGEF